MPARTVADVLNQRQRNPGVYSFGPIAIDVDVTRVQFRILRDTWESMRTSEFARLESELSFDSGTTWSFFIGCGVGGGRAFRDHDAQRVEVFESSVSAEIPIRGNRQIRGKLTIDERLSTKLDVDFIV